MKVMIICQVQSADKRGSVVEQVGQRIIADEFSKVERGALDAKCGIGSDI